MYSLVVADDEQNICKAVCAIVKSVCPEIKIADVFDNGEDLLHYLNGNHCDIIICDIQMGEVSGIDIAEYLHKNERDTQIILITGYRVFEYAQKAISYNVNSFLTKPFSSAELTTALNSAIEKIKHNIDASIHHNKSMLTDWRILREDVKSVFSGDHTKKRFPTNDFEYFDFCNCTIYEVNYYLESDNPEFDELTDKAMDMGEFSSEDTLCVFADANENSLCFVMFAKHGFKSNIVDDFIKGMNLSYNCQLSSSYEEFSTMQDYMIHCRFRKMLDRILNFSFEHNETDTDDYIAHIVKDLNSSEKEILRKYLISNFQKSDNDAILTIDRSADVITLLSEICHLLKADSPQYSLTEKIKKYIIDECSNYNLSLKSVAEHFSITPEYLSRIFKTANGIGFKTFIQKARIEKAKDLLINSKINTDEIAFSVGYSSSSHFKHLFKELTGISPAEYRKLKRN